MHLTDAIEEIAFKGDNPSLSHSDEIPPEMQHAVWWLTDKEALEPLSDLMETTVEDCENLNEKL